MLGADTTVTLDNAILGKPEDAADAARMLRLLQGRTHRVITGVALVTAERTEVAAEVNSRAISHALRRRRSPTTSRPASRWTKPAPTASRAAPLAGSRASKAATST